MEATESDTNHLDSDVLLPPRKRLLAGFKRQNSESPSQSSLENSSSPFPTEYETRLQNLLKSYKNGPRMSPEEIAKAAKSAAVTATKAAEAARAAAEEKAILAAKAVAAAKHALSLVATSPNRRQSKKNKMKKQVPVENLYRGQQQGEEIHRAPMDSPKNKHKKPKPTSEFENGEPNSKSEFENDGEPKSKSEFENDGKPNRKAEQVEEILVESPDGEKRGIVKKSLSICSDKDTESPKDEGSKLVSSGEETNAEKHVPIEPAATWKCTDINTPECIKTNEVVQS